MENEQSKFYLQLLLVLQVKFNIINCASLKYITIDVSLARTANIFKIQFSKHIFKIFACLAKTTELNKNGTKLKI